MSDFWWPHYCSCLVSGSYYCFRPAMTLFILYFSAPDCAVLYIVVEYGEGSLWHDAASRSGTRRDDTVTVSHGQVSTITPASGTTWPTSQKRIGYTFITLLLTHWQGGESEKCSPAGRCTWLTSPPHFVRGARAKYTGQQGNIFRIHQLCRCVRVLSHVKHSLNIF